MDAIRIRGGKRLAGTVLVSGAKNAALPILCATLLSDGESLLRNVPALRDIDTTAALLRFLGRGVEVNPPVVTVAAGSDVRPEAPYELVKQMRASVLVLGPLLARFGRAKVSLPGGCAIGARPIDQHLKGLEAMGATIRLERGELSDLEALVLKMRAAGVEIASEGQNVRVRRNGPLRPVNVTTAPHPGFPTDMQAQFLVLMSLARGESVISETIFENRFMHVPELQRMGASVALRGNTAVVQGVGKLYGASVMATDLRANASLGIAGLVAEEETEVRRVYHLDRGYEHIEDKLRGLGANIERVKGAES